MYVIDHFALPRHHDAGRQRVLVAGARFGFAPFELWIETLDPLARVALEPHGCDRVALVLAGHGSLLLDGAPQRFHAPCTLILPHSAECEWVNIGAEPLHLVMGVPMTAPLVDGPPAKT
jgi:hypothetical protein